MILQVQGGMKYNKLYNAATEGEEIPQGHLALSEFPKHNRDPNNSVFAPQPS